MARTKRNRIANFDKRLDWICANLVPSGHGEGASEKLDDAYLRREVWKSVRAISAHNGFEPRAWHGWRKEGNPPDHVLHAIREIYPELNFNNIDLLTCDWNNFTDITDDASVAMSRWRAATNYFNKNRAEIECFGKQIYVNIDEFSERLPLLGLNCWLPDSPIRLMPGHRQQGVKWSADFFNLRSPPIALSGLLPPFHMLKISMLSRGARRPTNDQCFMLSQIENTPGGVEFQIRTGRYFDYIDSCEAHAAFIADLYLKNIKENDGDIYADFSKGGIDCSKLFDLRSRCAAIGVNCLLITKKYSRSGFDGGRNLFWLHRRGQKTVEAQGVFHVMPSGGHAPLTKGYARPEEMNFWSTAVRELMEEFFGQEEFSLHDKEVDYCASHNSVYRAVVESGSLSIYYLGMGLDPATLKPEVLCLIIVDWPIAQEAYNSDIRGELIDQKRGNWEGELLPNTLSTELMKNLAITPEIGYSMLPAGAACLKLAAHHIERGSLVI